MQKTFNIILDYYSLVYRNHNRHYHYVYLVFNQNNSFIELGRVYSQGQIKTPYFFQTFRFSILINLNG